MANRCDKIKSTDRHETVLHSIVQQNNDGVDKSNHSKACQQHDELVGVRVETEPDTNFERLLKRKGIIIILTNIKK